MRTLPIDATDTEIKQLVVEWSERLAEGKYEEALNLMLFSTEEYPWTPELLKSAINGYGVPHSDEETTKLLLAEYEAEEFVVSSLANRDDKDNILDRKIQVDRESLYGLDPNQYLGMVHYEGVPLCGYLSDLTAQFYLKKVGSHQLTLEFLNIHVM